MNEAAVTMQEWALNYGPKVVAAIAILAIGWVAARLVRTLVRRTLRKADIDPTLTAFTASLAYATLLAFVIVAAVGRLGVQTTSFVAVIGAAGLAVGLALQGSLSNFAAGVLMIVLKPFRTGDYIAGGGTEGLVGEIGIFATVLTSPDNKKLIVPNAKIFNDNIVNYTANDTRRVDLIASVGYDDDLANARRVLESILAAEPRVLPEPAPTIGVLALADSSVNLAVRPWVRTADYWDAYFALQEAIKTRFDAEGISIPFPQRDIHVHQAA